MHIKKLLPYCLWLALVIAATPVSAAGIDPALTTPEENARQRQLESQEQQRQQEILKSLRQQQEIKPDVRDEMDALKQAPLKASTRHIVCTVYTSIYKVQSARSQCQSRVRTVCTCLYLKYA